MRISCLLVLGVTTMTMPTQGQSVSPKPVRLSQFRELTWLIGRWRGSSRWSPPFYEQCRFRDDSTIAMAAYTDSTFLSETADSSMIEWHGGRVQSRTPRATYEVIEFGPGRIRFRRIGATDGGHRFTRVSADEWTATIFPHGARVDTTIFQMRRVPEPSIESHVRPNKRFLLPGRERLSRRTISLVPVICGGLDTPRSRSAGR